MNPSSLPVRQSENEIVRALQTGQRLILEAPTGSGKSTQVPRILLEHGFCERGEIVVLQPRRLPARMLAKRVAEEHGCRLGEEVGYQIRFERVVSRKTRIRFVTEGILLRQIMDDPKLPGVAAILFDEFHERHLFGDVTLARALQVQRDARPDLKLVVMSATLQTESLREYLAPCAVLHSEGRTFPVDIEYLPPAAKPQNRPVWELAARELARLADDGLEGHVLIFMPGAYEIQATLRALRDHPSLRNIPAFPLHGELPPDAQDAAVALFKEPKIIVSTNVAETSLTIDGVRIVVDSGLARIARYDPHRGINTLLIEKIARASADQRAGRAGRTAPGRCLRLWTEAEHTERPAIELPEIKRLDLAEILLTLRNSGIENPAAFPWIEPPAPAAFERAECLLHELGAIDADGRLTPVGRSMASFPLHPRYSRMLLAAHNYACVPEIALIAALTQTRDVLVRRPDSRAQARRDDLLGDQRESDFFAQVEAWNLAAANRFSLRECREAGIHAAAARQVAQAQRLFLAIAERENLNIASQGTSSEALRRCILLGFSDQVARRTGRGSLHCEMVHGRRGSLSRDSVVRAPLFVASEVREVESRPATSRSKEPAGRGPTGSATSSVTVLLNLATAIEETWLEEDFPGDCRTEKRVRFNPETRRVVAEEQRLFRDLILRSRNNDDVPPDEAAGILADEILAGRCPLKHWDYGVDQWIARLNLVASKMPEFELPPIRDADKKALIEQIAYGAMGYKEIKERPVLPVVKSWLSTEQQALIDEYAPVSFKLPRGRSVKIAYAENESPVLSARIQDLYDLNENIRIADGRVDVVIHILAPNQRPIQVTRNIAEFWKTGYPEVKKQLQGRYPKHEWR